MAQDPPLPAPHELFGYGFPEVILEAQGTLSDGAKIAVADTSRGIDVEFAVRGLRPDRPAQRLLPFRGQ
jgi:hypothetical protein